MTPGRIERAGPEIVAPTNRINVALPISQIKLQEPPPDLVELAEIVADLAREHGDEKIREAGRGSLGPASLARLR